MFIFPVMKNRMSWEITNSNLVLYRFYDWIRLPRYMFRADASFVPSQWETVLLCNDVSHWLGANLESILYAMHKRLLPFQVIYTGRVFLTMLYMDMTSLTTVWPGSVSKNACRNVRDWYTCVAQSIWEQKRVLAISAPRPPYRYLWIMTPVLTCTYSVRWE